MEGRRVCLEPDGPTDDQLAQFPFSFDLTPARLLGDGQPAAGLTHGGLRDADVQEEVPPAATRADRHFIPLQRALPPPFGAF